MASPVRTAVVIPCFNDGAYVVEAVASLSGEEPHELVIVDDGSTEPETAERLGELEAGGLRVIRQENGGLAAARMTGVAATTAPYVYPLDADDLLCAGALARLADALDADPGAAVAYGNVEMFGAASNFFDNSDSRLDPWLITYLSNLPGTSMVRRSLLLEAGGWQLNEGGYEDWDLWMSMAERGFRSTYAPGMQFRYRISADGRMWSDAMGKHERLYDQLRARHPALFERRRELRRISSARRREKLLFPLIDAVPGWGPATRQRWVELVHDPGHIIVPRLRALAGLPGRLVALRRGA
jgi:glycosyltransferase involved in cell wall biosynthesis